MYKRIVFCLFLSIGLTVNAQTTINLSGTVSNNAGKPVAGAIVTLVKQKLTDTIGADGKYSITGQATAALPLLIPRNRTIFMDKGFLVFSLPGTSPVKVEIFDLKGILLKKELLQNAVAGFYHFKIEVNSRAANLLVIRASIGQDAVTFQYLPLNSGKYMLNQFNESGIRGEGNKLSKIAAINDTLKTTASGYQTNVKAITSYEQTVNISLDTIGGGGVVRSPGCGKATTIKGEVTQTITVGGKERQFLVRLPTDYDPSQAYKLWYGIHCIGGTMTMFADMKGYEYYGLWKFANPEGGKGTTIFCSPQGLSNAWWDTDGQDVEFFRALTQKLENDFCIDTTRMFASGFSMGGSMSYALACAMPSTFRAIAMFDGGAMSGCKHSTPPHGTAMFITHGTQDEVVGYPKSGPAQLADIAKIDGCTTLDVASVCKPTDFHPVCANYTGCDTKYPCRACIFVGGHDYMGGAGSTDKSWVDDSTWSFFKQFY
jgi:predicted esterase